MSIYATTLDISDERQTAARLKAAGINYGVICEDGEVDIETELPPESYDAPIIYEGSHVLPSDDSPRGGSVDLAMIPDHITRDGRDDAPEGALKDWLRLSVRSEDSRAMRDGEPRERGASATVVLTRWQVQRLRDSLTGWLESEWRD